MRQLRCHLHASVAPGRHGTLFVQRVRPVPQDERHEPASGQARQEIGRVRDGEHASDNWGFGNDEFDSRCCELPEKKKIIIITQ